MQKTLKRTLALILAVMLCLGAIPFSAFAAEMPTAEELSSEAPSSDGTEDSNQPDENTYKTSEESQPDSSPDISDESSEPQEEDTGDTAEPITDPDDSGLAPGTELDMNRVWPALRRAQARAAGKYGTDGTLYVGDYCFPGGVGTPPTLGEYIGPMPIETMRYGSNTPMVANILARLKWLRFLRFSCDHESQIEPILDTTELISLLRIVTASRSMR